MRLIDAEAYDKKLHDVEHFHRRIYVSSVRGEMVDYCRKLLKHAPTVDAEPVRHAHNDGIYAECDQFVCSECGIELQDWTSITRDDDGEELYHEFQFRYCPNCGAKMDEEDNDD